MSYHWIIEAQVDPANASTWVDISTYVQSISLTVGRDDDLGQAQISNLSVMLENDDGRFSPENSLGVYYPRITFNRGVRAKVDINGTITTKFTGHSVGWRPEWTSASPSRVQLIANDFLEKAAHIKSEAYAAGTILRRMKPDGYWPLQDLENLPDLSGNGATAQLDQTEGPITQGDPIGYTAAYDAGLAPYWGPSLGMGENAREYNQAYVNDDPRYGVPNQPLSVHFRVRLADNAPMFERNLLGAGVGATPTYTLSQRFIDQRWAIYTSNTHTVHFARGNADGTTQSSWSTGRVLSLGVGYSIILVSTATRFRMYENGVLVVDSTVDTSLKRSHMGLLWMGGLRPAQGQSAMAGLRGRISDVAIWGSRDITTDPLFTHLLASHRGWHDDLPGARIGRYLDIARLPAADRTLAAGSSVLVPFHEAGNLADLIRHTAHSDQGLVYVDGAGKVIFEGRTSRWQNRRSVVATFGGNAGETPFTAGGFSYDRTDLANHVVVTGAAEEAVSIRSDAASRDEFGLRELPIDIDVDDIPTLAGRASIELQARKGMKMRLPRLDLAEIDSDDRANTVVALKLEDLVRTYVRPTGEDVITARQRLQKVIDTVSNGGYSWVVTLGVSDAEVDADITTYGTAAYGTARFGY